ncbi:MAG: DUF4258 domain-containing protein [Tildeniella nuda ZEHNDER 1965/U140]|jgi:hypothetical protein|nr:DUF4258 domain-containing protein [Tildeniella nuda ZEHNDER 1965/U140]
MKTIDAVRQQLYAGQFEFSRHAFKRAIERNISEQEIREAGLNAISIEAYPNDKYSPSCLLLGFTATHRPLHIQVSLAQSELVRIITLYEPNNLEWINYSQRR